jgi:hypothetical protein
MIWCALIRQVQRNLDSVIGRGSHELLEVGQ